MEEERKSYSTDGKVREMQADVRECPKSILFAAVCDSLTPIGEGERERERKHNNKRHKQEIFRWTQN